MQRITPKEPAFNDDDLMSFGMYQGKKLEDVPASYLLWAWEELASKRDEKLDNYIFNNMNVLREECKDRIVRRKE